MEPDLSIVIVSWNVRDLLKACLESIQSGPVMIIPAGEDPTPGQGLGVEVIVVDSGSSDGSPQMVRERFPWVKLIEPGYNVGFSKGNNIGLEASRGRYVFFLNPDTKVLGGALPRMIAYMDTHPEVGALGPQLLNADGSVQSSRRRFPTLWTAFFEATWLEPTAPPGVIQHFRMLDCSDEKILDVDWVTGAALLVRRRVIEQVGGMDEGFFMYSEELDWQRRIKAAGWHIVYYPEAKIIHYGGKSSEQATARRDIHFNTSKVRYYRKYHGPLVASALRAFLLADYTCQLMLEGAKWLLGHKPELRRERVRTYWQVIRSGLREQ